MNSTVIYIIETVLLLLLGFAATYFKSKVKLVRGASALIDKAQGIYTETENGEKMQYVCEQLHNMLPAPIRPFFPEAFIQNIAQKIFDDIKAFAVKKLDALTDKVTKTGKNAAADVQTGSVTETAKPVTAPDVKTAADQATAGTIPVPDSSAQ